MDNKETAGNVVKNWLMGNTESLKPLYKIIEAKIIGEHGPLAHYGYVRIQRVDGKAYRVNYDSFMALHGENTIIISDIAEIR